MAKDMDLGKLYVSTLSANDKYFLWLKYGIIRLLNVLYAIQISVVKL